MSSDVVNHPPHYTQHPSGAKPWSERNVSPKECRECRKVFQPKCGGSRYCADCSTSVKRRNHAKSQREWRAKDPERHANIKTKWDLGRYGIDVATYDRMLREQNGACAICGNASPGGKGVHRKFAIDHCHSTGVVRGLLCNLCNPALGLFSDSPEKLRAAIKYLEKRHG